MDAVTAAILGLSILLVTGVVTWKECLSEAVAWDTLTWFAALIAMAGYLNKYGLISWFSQTVVKVCPLSFFSQHFSQSSHQFYILLHNLELLTSVALTLFFGDSFHMSCLPTIICKFFWHLIIFALMIFLVKIPSNIALCIKFFSVVGPTSPYLQYRNAVFVV